MQKLLDTERFIMEIHNRPCIWNPKVEQSAQIKREAWTEVAEIVCNDFHQIMLDEKSTTKRIQELQKKWKGLRDYYNREKDKSAKVKKRERETPILDMLHFLRAVYVSKSTDQTSGDTNEINLHYPTGSDDSQSSNDYFTPKTKKVKGAEETLSNTPISTPNKNDPDMNFLLTILPEMKSMNPEQNFEFRFGVMKIIKKLKYSRNDYGLPERNYGFRKYTTFVDALSPSNDSVDSSEEDRKPIIQDCEDVLVTD